MTWRPIETAPRDGTNILVWPYVGTAWFGEYRLVTMAWFDDNLRGWSIIGMGVIIDPPPSHWMPLPEPPKEGA